MADVALEHTGDEVDLQVALIDRPCLAVPDNLKRSSEAILTEMSSQKSALCGLPRALLKPVRGSDFSTPGTVLGTILNSNDVATAANDLDLELYDVPRHAIIEVIFHELTDILADMATATCPLSELCSRLLAFLLPLQCPCHQ
ncbi:hypothetical protein JZ751_012516 [Albula glossodonta]|uniref:Uncharacterized protein n=1 Tax=Albula glossodonta TaxID=121402 RepID=A0A8T2NXI5_9TELE|nr:hypothetical protein JZ751_012516 [Albula glossodonta]